jgi:hypothetical protein
MPDDPNGAHESITLQALLGGVDEAQAKLRQPDLTLEQIGAIRKRLDDLYSRSSYLFFRLTPDDQIQLRDTRERLIRAREEVVRRQFKFLKLQRFICDTCRLCNDGLKDLDAKCDTVSQPTRGRRLGGTGRSPLPRLDSEYVNELSKAQTIIYITVFGAINCLDLENFGVEVTIPRNLNRPLTGDEIRNALSSSVSSVYTGAVKAGIEEFAELYDRVNMKLARLNRTLSRRTLYNIAKLRTFRGSV